MEVRVQAFVMACWFSGCGLWLKYRFAFIVEYKSILKVEGYKALDFGSSPKRP